MQTSLERPLAGQSKNLFNLAAEFALQRILDARCSFNYFGDRISDVGANEAPDIIEEGRGSLDLVFAQRIRGLGIRLTLENLTDSDYLFTQTLTAAETQRLYKLGPHGRAVVRLQRVLRTRHDDHKEHTRHHAVVTHRIRARVSRRVASSAGSLRVSADQAPPVNVPGIDKPVIVVTGEVTGSETWVNTNYYVLRGAVFVRERRDAEHPGGHHASSASPAASAR